MTARAPLISPDLLALPAARTVVVSPSDRARRAFARVWAIDLQRSRERRAALLPRFVTIKAWFATLWEEGQLFGWIDDTRTLCSPLIEMALWRHVATVVSGVSRAESVLLAERFSEAWALEHGYRDRNGRTAFATGTSGELYRAAREQFCQALQNANALTAAQLPFSLASQQQIQQQICNQHIAKTPFFSWQSSDFDVLSKITNNFIDARINMASSFVAKANSTLRFDALDPQDERNAAIAWALQKLDLAGGASGEQSVAIVVPDLQRTRGVWQRALRDAGLPFNLSLGLAVSKYPWAAAGFTLVGAMVSPFAPETIAQALRHPRWGRTEATIAAINRREIELLRRGVPEVTLPAFFDPAVDALRATSERLAPVVNEFAKRGGRETRVHWRGVFERAIVLLTDLSPPLDSQTYQLREALLSSIQTWQTLDQWLPRVSASEAQQELIAITDGAAFQPEGSDAPIQVMGLLESAGVPFDAMWITGLSERVLPEAARANPFLSAIWQKDNRAGLASLDECDARAARLVSGWKNLSGEVVASLPKKVGDQIQVWSPLAAVWEICHAAHENPLSRRSRSLIETVNDEFAPPWQTPASRGVRALEAQANCPRRGFAEARLRLTAWPEPSDGLSMLTRGNLVHHIAERLGRRLQSEPMQFEPLLQALPEVVAAAVRTAAAEHKHLPDHVWQVESSRLETVFTRLLQVEAKRAPFTVASVEQSTEIALGRLKFSLRVDRVDRLDGVEANIETPENAPPSRLAVIDFKSGIVDRASMFDERLTSPQLPLYAYALGLAQVKALAYARVGDDHQDFLGIGDTLTGFEAKARDRSKVPPWDELVAQWQIKLETLANELAQGEATVTPAFGEKTCRKCSFQRFCRVDFQRIAAPEGDDATEEGEP